MSSEPTRIELRFPCPKRWSELEGTGPRRHCSACNHSVTNLSLLTRAEAAPVLAQRAERRTCVAFRTDAAGGVIFAESSGRSARWARLARSAAACLAFLFPFLAGCRRSVAPGAEPRPSPGTESSPSSATSATTSAGSADASASPDASETLGEIEYMGYAGD